jgi:hypothetical protein
MLKELQVELLPPETTVEVTDDEIASELAKLIFLLTYE